ncbi:hypothetical protein D915_002294 [Fasciola hepatica]|uniref:Uncharacterized protein n=1 Tax=Fasciola hepatica TaxID=6192 RepID=A0A4E0S347_FASHE|nr:hypothetical protein D915_002294 [Fasciola hepatica]
MATASLPLIEVTNHPPSHKASVDSILTECEPYATAATSTRSRPQTGTNGRPSGCIPLIYSPARRSSSLARQHLPHQRRGKKDGTKHSDTSGGGADTVAAQWRLQSDEKTVAVASTTGPRRTQLTTPQLSNQCEIGDSNERNSMCLSVVGPAETRKSHTLTVSTSNKESGGRKILNFFQRGFTPRRPKSVTKMERRKSPPKCLHPDSEGVNHHHPNELTITDPMEAIRLLNRQIPLPKELIGAFHWDSFTWPEAMLSRSSGNPTAQIRPVDPSLIATNCRHCFQVVSQNIGTLVTQSNNSQNICSDIGNGCKKDKCKDNRKWDNGQKSSNEHFIMIPSYSADCLGHPTFNNETANTVQTYSCPSTTERDRWIY